MSEWDAKISRVDQPEPGLLAISFRDRGRNETLLLVALPGVAQLDELVPVDVEPRQDVLGADDPIVHRHSLALRHRPEFLVRGVLELLQSPHVGHPPIVGQCRERDVRLP